MKNSLLTKPISNPESLIIRDVVSTRKIEKDLEVFCKNTWNEMLVEAKNENKKLWDSEIYRFESVSESDNIVHFEISTIPFSVVLSMNKYIKQGLDFNKALAPLGMFTSCFVKTSDDKYLFIEKSNKFYTKKKISFIGGTLSKTEKVIKNGGDLFGEVKKELIEELGLKDRDIEDIVLLSVYKTKNLSVCLLFDVELKCGFDEVQTKFNFENDGEAVRIIDVDSRDLSEFAINNLDDLDNNKIYRKIQINLDSRIRENDRAVEGMIKKS
jgi:hypothetical protein